MVLVVCHDRQPSLLLLLFSFSSPIFRSSSLQMLKWLCFALDWREFARTGWTLIVRAHARSSKWSTSIFVSFFTPPLFFPLSALAVCWWLFHPPCRRPPPSHALKIIQSSLYRTNTHHTWWSPWLTPPFYRLDVPFFFLHCVATHRMDNITAIFVFFSA